MPQKYHANNKFICCIHYRKKNLCTKPLVNSKCILFIVLHYIISLFGSFTCAVVVWMVGSCKICTKYKAAKL